jgi:hypothetical protein
MVAPRGRAALVFPTRRSLRLVALAVAALPRIARAAVDMTGDWYAAGGTGPVTAVHFTQTGMVLQTNIGATGTIDSATGAFVLFFPIVNPSDCGGAFHGQVGPAGDTFIAPGNAYYTPAGCQSFACACFLSAPAEFRGSRSPCGNGIVDAGEQCDDASLGRGGSCCELGCTVKPDGTSCDDGFFCNGQETTCTAGACQQGAAPCLFNCDEGSDTCLAGCPSAPQGCRAAGKSRLFLRRSGDASRDRLSWSWSRGAATSQMEFGDPTATTTYALCIYAGASPALIDQLIIPAGATRWKLLGTAGYKYKDAIGAAEGIEKVLLKGSTQSRSKIRVVGKGTALPDVSLPVTEPMTVQLVHGDTGVCWDASYGSVQLLANDGGVLKARTP